MFLDDKRRPRDKPLRLDNVRINGVERRAEDDRRHVDGTCWCGSGCIRPGEDDWHGTSGGSVLLSGSPDARRRLYVLATSLAVVALVVVLIQTAGLKQGAAESATADEDVVEESEPSPFPARIGSDDAVIVTASAEMLNLDNSLADGADVPVVVEIEDPGRIIEGETVTHDIAFRSTGEDVVIEDPRIGGLPGSDDGLLVASGYLCGPDLVDQQLTLTCADSLNHLSVGRIPAVRETALWTDDDLIGADPLTPGIYTISPIINIARTDDDVTEGNFIGQYRLGISYDVRADPGE